MPSEEADGGIGELCTPDGGAVLDQKFIEKPVCRFTSPACRVMPINIVVYYGRTQGTGVSRRKYQTPEKAGNARPIALKPRRNRETQISPKKIRFQ